jgi:hypothetical protein
MEVLALSQAKAGSGLATRRAPKYRFELLIPTRYNDGEKVEVGKIQHVRRTLIGRFGGCRMQPGAPYQGWWQQRERMYEDWLVLFTVEGDRVEDNLLWFETYKNEALLDEFRQLEIYLAVSEITWLETVADTRLASEAEATRSSESPR